LPFDILSLVSLLSVNDEVVPFSMSISSNPLFSQYLEKFVAMPLKYGLKPCNAIAKSPQCTMDKNLSHDPIEDDFQLPAQNAEKLAKEGNADAQFWVGFNLASAGTKDAYVLAANWYQRAAEQGHALAQFNLGIMYSRGQGFRRDAKTSTFWITKAAQRGDCAAQYILGMNQNRRSMNETAVQASESRIEAYKWLQLSASQGYVESEAGCDFVAMGMTVEGVREGKRRAAVFVCDTVAPVGVKDAAP
jgi:hypothetical protein